MAYVVISVVIPVKNAEHWIYSQHEAFMTQTLINETEFVYIDSGSTDNTVEIIQTFPQTKLIQIAPEEFNHGQTRNLGVAHASGKYVVMTVQDAKPSSSLWLEYLIKGFVDETVAGVCGQQAVPHEPDKNPIEWFRSFSKPGLKRIFVQDHNEYKMLSPLKKRELCGWDDVNTIYRRSILLTVPFRHINFGEDGVWAQDVLLKGFALVYNSYAQVYHYHHEDYHYTFKRTIANAYAAYKAFGLVPDTKDFNITLKKIAGFLRTLVREHSVSWPDKWKWLNYTLAKKKASKHAVIAFNRALGESEVQLDKLYNLYCEKSPVAVGATNAPTLLKK